MNNNDLIFATRKGSNQRTNNDTEVSLTLIGSGKYVALSIRKDVVAMLGQGDCITAARLGGRLYIKKCDQASGFKLQDKNHCSRVYAQIPAKALKIKADWVGHYRIWWNSERELFYIDNERRS